MPHSRSQDSSASLTWRYTKGVLKATASLHLPELSDQEGGEGGERMFELASLGDGRHVFMEKKAFNFGRD